MPNKQRGNKRCAKKSTQHSNRLTASQKQSRYFGKSFQSSNTNTNQPTFSSDVMYKNKKKISTSQVVYSHGYYSSQSVQCTTNFVPNLILNHPIITVKSPSQQTSTSVRRKFYVANSSQSSQQWNINSINRAPNNSIHVKSFKPENVHYKQKNENKNVHKKIDINTVVRELCKCEGFFCFLNNLSQKLNINDNELLKSLEENNHVFSTLHDPEKGDSLVELCPKLELCNNHQQDGCIMKICSHIHLCEDFIYSNCIKKDCPLGHMSNFKSDHNLNILKKYFISTLPNTSLRLLFQKVCTTIPTLYICLDYNQKKCKLAEKCENLHICYSYVNTLGFCSLEDCNFSHDIRDTKIILFLQSLGLSSNECPRDILKILKDRCIEKEKENYLKETSKTPIVDKSSEIDIKDGQIHENKKEKEIKKSLGANQRTKKRSVYCTDFYGSVESTKICLDGIKLNCKLTDCPFFHCFHKSHWQFGNGDKWYNFNEYHSQILDSTYSDPNCEEISLPKLDFSRLNTSQIGLITLLGKNNLQIDFNKMTLFCESTDKTYYIWNLTTESSVFANENNEIENFTVFKWYFQDDDGIWNIFDNSDSSSLLFEKDYFQCSDDVTKFTSTEFSYLIDFETMTQENETTNKIRPLRRRSYIQRKDNCSTDSKKDECKEIFRSPQTWEDLNNEPFKLVKLNSTDDEYLDIRQKLLFSLPLIKRIKVWRIHYNSQWEIFKNKHKTLEKERNSEFLNVQKLFHGIDIESIDETVKENLDHLKNGTGSESPYGEGIYFFKSASAGATICSSDLSVKQTLLVAEVIIGNIAQGSPGLTREETSTFDTTTDNIENPTVFVKYNSQEYYPLYVVEFFIS